jgi:CheY-like chemotaxis protein
MHPTDQPYPRRKDRPSVLIVADDPDIRMALRDLLEYDGYRVEEASTCREALQHSRRTSFATILLDVGLLDGDGPSFTGQLERADPPLPIIVLSAYAFSDYRRHRLPHEVFSWLSTPYDREKLRAEVRRAVAWNGPTGPIAKTGD